ncbi:MAG: radical SAM protein [Elusimicrobiota bacterium]
MPRTAAKWTNPDHTADGKTRAAVGLGRLKTLWFNTGTRCNLACANCYIKSSPRNDRLAYITKEDMLPFIDELAAGDSGAAEIGFTGGEPFLNPHLAAMLEECLARGFTVLILTNAMTPMMRKTGALMDLRGKYRKRLRFRVSLDHYTAAVHEAERGPGSWSKAVEGLRWLAANGFVTSVAGRSLTKEKEPNMRAGYRRLFAGLGIELDSSDPERLILFPELDDAADPPEISTACWRRLNRSPASVMCASSRMVVKRKCEDSARVAACTLLPHDARFDLGRTLRESSRPVSLAHPYCASFCVLGGASCAPG